MSRYSAEISYLLSKWSSSFYFRGRRNGNVIEEIHLAKSFRLSSIIHEINECEIVHLLAEEFAEETNNIEKIKLTLKLVWRVNNRFKEKVFDGVGEREWISHLISPYACVNCFMPRRKYRVFW